MSGTHHLSGDGEPGDVPRGPDDYLSRLEEMVAEAARSPGRRPGSPMPLAVRILAVAAAIVFGVVALALWTGARDDAEAGGVAITETGSEIRVRIEDPSAAPDDIEAALAESGVTAEVDSVPVSPSLVGRWVGGATLGTGDVDVEEGDATVLVIPAGFSGSIELLFGRQARSGESYVSSANAFDRGDLLSCSPLHGRAAPIVVQSLLDDGWTVRGVIEERDASAVEVEPADAGRDLVVVQVIGLDPGTLQVLATDSPERYRPPEGCG